MIVRTMEGKEFKCTAELPETEIDTWVKEDAEFLDTDAEKFGKEEMSALVQQHKEHETEQQLGSFDQKYFHWMNAYFWIYDSTRRRTSASLWR